MLCESCSEPIAMRSVVRQQNRALRTIVRRLRATVRNGQEHSDEMFVALCDTDPSVENAMRRLWEEGGFAPPRSPEGYPFGPSDYEEVVETCLRALKAYRQAAATPAQSESASKILCCTSVPR